MSAVSSVAYLTALKVIGLSIGLLYSILQVRYFGASVEVDAFFIAMSAVYLVTSLTQGGQLAEVFLPEYLSQKETHGIDAASLLLSVVINRTIGLLGGVLGGLYFLAPWIIEVMGAGLSPEFQQLAIAIFRTSLVLILFNIIAAFVNTTLIAEQVFGRSEWTGLVNGLISITVLVSFYHSLGIWVLVLALILGKVVEFLIGLVFLRKIGFKYRLKWRVPNYEINQFFRVLFTTSGYVGATQIYNVILTSMASFLPDGVFSIYNYVQQLSTKAKGIVITPVATVFFAKFAKLKISGQENYRRWFTKPLVAIGVFAFLQFCFVLALSKELLQVFWSEKALSAAEFGLAVIMLSLNMLGVTFSAIGTIFRKAVVALQDAKTLYRGWTITQLICALYTYLAIQFFGVYGLASIPVVNMALMAAVSLLVGRRHGLGLSMPERKEYHLLRIVMGLTLVLLIALLLKAESFETLSTPAALLVKAGLLSLLTISSGFLLFGKQLSALLSRLLNGTRWSDK